MKRLWILVALVVVGLGAWAVLFQTDLMPKQKIAASKFIEDLLAVGLTGRIGGIVSSEGSFTALIDGQAVREGESIHGVTIVRILPDEVEFEKNGRRWTQSLNAAPTQQWQADAEPRAQAKAKAQEETEAKARVEAEVKAEEEVQAKPKAEAETKTQAEAEAKAQAEAEAKAKLDAEAKALAEVEAKAQAEAEAKAQMEAAAKAQAEAEAKAQAEAEAKEKAEAATKIEPVKIDEAVQENIALRQPPTDESTQKAVVELIGQLGDKEPFVRDPIVARLVQIGPPAVPILLKVIEDEDWVIRQGASQALGKIGDPQAVEPLIHALGDKNQWIRQYAAEALGLIGDKRAVEPLVEALKDDNPNVRKVAAEALVSIRGFATEAERPDKQQANTIIGTLIDLKIYIGAAAGAVLLLGGLVAISVKRRKRIPEWGTPHHMD
jgi:HEAT repeat protein